MISEVEKDEFWGVVQDCLVEFHQFSDGTATSRIRNERTSVESWSDSRIELFYHGEPFDVACGIAQQPLDFSKYHDQYLVIRDQKHGTGIAGQYFQQRSAKMP